MIQNIMNVSKSGLTATRNNIELTSSNIVNASTTGYKKLESQFQTLVSHSLDRESYPNYSENVATGTGIRTGKSFRVDDQGSFRKTGKFFNLALAGEGYFRVVQPDGTYAYTRDGEFNIDSSGRIVDNFGNLLDITFNNGYSYDNIDFSSTSEVDIFDNQIDFSIEKDGLIQLGTDVIGKINVYNTVGDDDLRSIRNNLFVPKEGVDMIQSKSTYMHQGYVESSNVNLSEEMTNLIALQRAYQLNSKGVSIADEMWALVNEM